MARMVADPLATRAEDCRRCGFPRGGYVCPRCDHVPGAVEQSPRLEDELAEEVAGVRARGLELVTEARRRVAYDGDPRLATLLHDLSVELGGLAGVERVLRGEP